MGDPKKSKKRFRRPFKAWDRDRIAEEKTLMKKYGLRRKKEIWKSEAALRNLKRRAREIIANRNPEEEKKLLSKIVNLGLYEEKEATLDNVLSIEVDKLLQRRLQSIIIKKEMANSMIQARQFITHGHIRVKGEKIISPSYIVKKAEEREITYSPKSSLNKTFKLKTKVEKKEKAKEEKKTRKEKVGEIKNIESGEDLNE